MIVIIVVSGLVAGAILALLRGVVCAIFAAAFVIASVFVRTIGTVLAVPGLVIVAAARAFMPALGGGAFLLLALVLILPLGLAWGFVGRTINGDDWRNAAVRAYAPAVLDRNGIWLGVLSPNSTNPNSDSSFDAHLAVPSAAPDNWMRCLTRLEDRHWGSWLAAAGIDPIAVARSLWSIPTGGRPSGASGLTAMLGRTLRGRLPNPQDSWRIKVARKVAETLDSPVVAAVLRDESPRQRERWLATQFLLIGGAPGSAAGELPHGVEPAARIVFGKSAADLDIVEASMLAAALWRPILFAPPGTNSELVEGRWKRLKARAALCVRSAFDLSPNEIAQALTRLRDLPAPYPHIDARLEKLLPKDPIERFRIAVNPARRLRYFLGSDTGVLDDFLSEATSNNWRGCVESMRLNIAADVNRQVTQSLSDAVGTIERKQQDRLQLSLSAGSEAQRAQIVVALAEDNHLLALYSNSILAYTRYDRGIASLGKIVAATLLGRTDKPAQSYCNLEVPGIHNSNGDSGVKSCREPHAWIPARTVFARSLNLPLLNALRRVPEKDILAQLQLLGFKLPPDAPPRAATVLGLASATPRDVQRMMTAISEALTEGDRQVGLPNLIDSIVSINSDGSTTESPAAANGLIKPSALFANNDSAKRFVRSVLSAPLENGGTLEALGAFRQGAYPGITLHIAKTGTSTTPDKSIRDVWIAGALVYRGRRLGYVILAGAPFPNRPLGHRIYGRHLVPLAKALLSNLPVLVETPGRKS